jgi:ParB/RepB/Spo0J family partition protein
MKVEDVALDKIVVEGRTREDLGPLSELVQSIKDKGVLQPITITHDFRLIFGLRRYEASKQAGLKSIPAIRRKFEGDLDEAEVELIENINRKDFTWVERARLEKRIFEYKSAKDPNWSQRKQAQEMEESRGSIGRRLQLAEALEIVPELAECKTEDEAWKSLSRAKEDVVIQALKKKAEGKYAEAAKFASDHYKIGDVFEGLENISDRVFGFAEVDPPYGVEIDRRKSRNKDTENVDRYNEVPAKEYSRFVSRLAEEVYRVLKDNTFCVWWYGMSWHSTVHAALIEVGFKVNDIPAIWTKPGAGQTASPDTMLASCYEPFFVCRKGEPKLRKPGRGNVFHFSTVPPQKKIHTTEKPVELLLDILDTFTYPGQTIIVPFLGSGVTLRAAYKRQMTGVGWDLDEVIKNRFIAKVADDQSGGEDGQSE